MFTIETKFYWSGYLIFELTLLTQFLTDQEILSPHSLFGSILNWLGDLISVFAFWSDFYRSKNLISIFIFWLDLSPTRKSYLCPWFLAQFLLVRRSYLCIIFWIESIQLRSTKRSWNSYGQCRTAKSCTHGRKLWNGINISVQYSLKGNRL